MHVDVIPGYFSSDEELGFTWHVDQYDSQQLSIKLSFQNPEYVSTNGNSDQLEVKFMSGDYFYDIDDLPLANNTVIRKDLPK